MSLVQKNPGPRMTLVYGDTEADSLTSRENHRKGGEGRGGRENTVWGRDISEETGRKGNGRWWSRDLGDVSEESEIQG